MPKIQDYFSRNPFESLSLATNSSTSFELRGHEQQFSDTFNRIKRAVSTHVFAPEKAQHTIVFGEWGHGKSHLLRALEKKINDELDADAKAIFYEPMVTDPEGIIKELSRKLNISVNSIDDFIAALKNPPFPPNIFLLIDESQTLGGGDAYSDQDIELTKYYNFVDDLIQKAQSSRINLHIFHGFSANSAKAIEKISKLDLTSKLKKERFTLNSLSEDQQWEMIKDHFQRELKRKGYDIPIEEIIDRGVNRCINNIVGGNPRWVLMLMKNIFEASQDQTKIDFRTCYRALREMPRIDNPSQKFFDPLLIESVINLLKSGQKNEKEIADFFEETCASLLGGWEPVNVDKAGQSGLTTGKLRKSCPSLNNISIFVQNPDGDIRMTEDFQRLIQVQGPKNIIEPSERELLLDLSLDPEKSLRSLIDGFEVMLNAMNLPFFRDLQFGHQNIDVLYFETGSSGNVQAKIRFGLIIYKGQVIPIEVFRKIERSIQNNECVAFVIVEDANTNHEKPESTYNKFINEYSGNLQIENRVIFINSLPGRSEGFDENFFVKTIEIDSKSIEDQKGHYNLFGIEIQLNQLKDQMVYCPKEQEKELIKRLLHAKEGQNFTMKGLKELDPIFDWINAAALSQLGVFIEKKGSKYSSWKVDEIEPLKYLLKKIKDSGGISLDKLNDEFRKAWIMTGPEESKDRFVDWSVHIFINKGNVNVIDDELHIFEIEQEFSDLKIQMQDCLEKIEEKIKKFKRSGFLTSNFVDLERKSSDIKRKLNEDNLIILNEYKKLQGWNVELKELDSDLSNIVQTERSRLNTDLEDCKNSYQMLKDSIPPWPLDDCNDGYQKIFFELDKDIKEMASTINQETPGVRSFGKSRDKLIDNLKSIDEMINSPVEEIHESDDVNRSMLKIYSAIRQHRNGVAKITYQNNS
jgi:hypothetical protein